MAKPRRHFFGFQGEAKAAADLSFAASLFSLVFIPSVLILCFIFLSSSYTADELFPLGVATMESPILWSHDVVITNKRLQTLFSTG